MSERQIDQGQNKPSFPGIELFDDERFTTVLCMVIEKEKALVTGTKNEILRTLRRGKASVGIMNSVASYFGCDLNPVDRLGIMQSVGDNLEEIPQKVFETLKFSGKLRG